MVRTGPAVDHWLHRRGIATMLQTTPATVYQYVYEAKKRAGVKKPRGKATAKAE
jgi:hypothetical protein